MAFRLLSEVFISILSMIVYFFIPLSRKRDHYDRFSIIQF
ncbi:hypothetical protein DDD_2523 [Nonlabens dokdonensis DSW-6]|uniref:Uncharacterized protein n=1 Tax=Nonlabens dokdonensis (strain DSM 17205 / KCTC 12402 / DSW-6) TaxID=592029 RepID=L7WC22_NONDD|nr:hypothetical protein DDD_2523 [Nonlabens dokdonensis DSW-6]